MNKKAMSALLWIIIVIILILVTSTQKLTFNDKPISTGSPSLCGFMHKDYDTKTRTCVSKINSTGS